MPRRSEGHLCCRGKGNRWSVRLRVPADLRDGYTGTHVEKSLRTSDLAEARRRSHAVIADIQAGFERRRRGGLLDEDVARIADTEARRLYMEFATGPDIDPRIDSDFDYQITRARLGRAIDGAELDERDRERAAAHIRELGLDPTDDLIQKAHRAIARQSLRALLAVGQGRDLPQVGVASARLSVASEAFLDLKGQQGKLAVKTMDEYRSSFDLLQERLGDVPLADVTRTQAADFLSGLGVASATVNKRVTAFMGLWEWACKTGRLPEDHRNPWARQRWEVKPKGWAPFSIDELNLLIERPIVRPNRHDLKSARSWIVLIGLFSGMRLGEICSLDVRDVKERDGVTYFDIVAAKSEAGVRCVPVHSRLIDLGFLDYVKHICKGSLWPGLKAGGPYKAKAYVMSKAFVRWRRSYEVDRPQVAFHSLRKNVVDALENAGVHSSAVALVVGHEGGRGFTFGTYSGGLRLPGLRDVVERIWFRGLVSETAEGHQYCVWLPH